MSPKPSRVVEPCHRKSMTINERHAGTYQLDLIQRNDRFAFRAWPGMIDRLGKSGDHRWIGFQQVHACPSWGPLAKIPDLRFYTRNVPVRVDGEADARWCRWNTGSCNSTMAHPPRTRPDRHLRQLSRRRLTNWLLNYWATWPVIASYLTSTGYIGSWILWFEECSLFPYTSTPYAFSSRINDDSFI